MASRDDLVRLALADNGYLNGAGYDVPNRASADLGWPAEAWCGDQVTDWFRRNGTPLPSMQPGHPTGYSYCPSAVAYGRAHNAVVNSWQARPGDIVLFDWDGDGVSDHTELVTGWAGGALSTIGGNSGPSNVDGYTGAGGVHRHVWSAPVDIGSGLVIAVLDADKLVQFRPGATRYSGMPQVQQGSQGTPVRWLQTALDIVNKHEDPQDKLHLAVDGDFGPATSTQVKATQGYWLNHDGKHPEAVDGVVGQQTWAVLGWLQTIINR